MNMMFVLLNQAQDGGTMQFLIMMVLIFVVMYFFMIRPQQKRQKEAMKFRESLTPGTKVLTAGGVYGTVKHVNDTTVAIEIASGVEIKVDKAMIVRDPSDITAK